MITKIELEQLILQKPHVDMQILQKLIENLERGQKYALKMRSLILLEKPRCEVEDYYKALDHHSMVCLDTYITSLSMHKTFDFGEVFAGKRNQHHLDDDDHDHDEVNSIFDHCFSEVSADHRVPKMSTPISYKRSRKNNGELREEVVDTHMAEDGYTWRKYGQKVIKNASHRREYYRCTYKYDKKCQATKYIQQVSDKPSKYKVIYKHNHTCRNNILESSKFIIDFPKGYPSSRVLNFDRSNQVDPTSFPSSTLPIVVPSVSQDSSSMSLKNNHSITQDNNATVATTTEISEKSVVEASIAENHCSCSTASLMDVGEEYSFTMAECDDILQNWLAMQVDGSSF